MPKIIKITQADIDKLSPEIRSNPALMALVNTIVTSYTQLEKLLGYDVVLVAADAPVEEKPAGVCNDAPGVELSVRCAGREIANDGRATYLGGILTTRPADGWRNICVQFNDITRPAGQGEVTVWKDEANNAERKDVIRNANKIVVWMER